MHKSLKALHYEMDYLVNAKKETPLDLEEFMKDFCKFAADGVGEINIVEKEITNEGKEDDGGGVGVLLIVIAAVFCLGMVGFIVIWMRRMNQGAEEGETSSD